MTIPEDLTLLAPWRQLSDSPRDRERARVLSEELRREVTNDHPLSGLDIKAVATRADQDDVLFEVFGGEKPLAVVHMTWRKEADLRWPRTRWFSDWQDWVKQAMLPDHNDMDDELFRIYVDRLSKGPFPTDECAKAHINGKLHGELVLWLADIAGMSSWGWKLLQLPDEKKSVFHERASRSFSEGFPSLSKRITPTQTPKLAELVRWSEQARTLILRLLGS